MTTQNREHISGWRCVMCGADTQHQRSTGVCQTCTERRIRMGRRAYKRFWGLPGKTVEAGR